MPRENTGPKLRRNDEGIYEIRWSDAGRSRRRSTSERDLSSAQKVFGNFLILDERERAKLVAAEEGELLVYTIMGDHKAPREPGPRPRDYWHEHVLPNVVDKASCGYAFDKLLAHFGPLPVRDISPADVRDYVDRRRAGELGRVSCNHTISRELSVLNAAIHHAVKEKRLAKADQPFIKLPGTSPPRDRWLSHDEADRLLTAALERVDPHSPKDRLPRVYRFIVLALETASRKTAVLELTRRQVDLDRGVIYLNPHGREQTNKRRPPVPISDFLRPVLARTLDEIGAKPESHLLDHDGDIRTAFENVVKRAGLGTDVTPHVLRHTSATWKAQAGVSMFDLAGILGDTVMTVTKTYAHHCPDHLRSAINAGRNSGHNAPLGV